MTCRNIVAFRAAGKSGDTDFLVQEYIAGGQLQAVYTCNSSNLLALLLQALHNVSSLEDFRFNCAQGNI